MSVLKEAADKITKRAQDASNGNMLMDMWGKLAPENQEAVRNALIGSAVGGTLLGGIGAANRRPDESLVGSFGRNALLGALLGAGVGGGGTMAKNYTMGTYRTPTEQARAEDRPVLDSAADATLRGALGNLGPLAGGVVGGGLGHKYLVSKSPTLDWTEYLQQTGAGAPEYFGRKLEAAGLAGKKQGPTAALAALKSTGGAANLRKMLADVGHHVVTPRGALAGAGVLGSSALLGALLGRGAQRMVEGENVV